MYEFASHFGVYGTEQWVVLWVIGGVIGGTVVLHIATNVFRLDVVAEAIRVGEQQGRALWTVPCENGFVVEFIHESLGYLEDRESRVDWLHVTNLLPSHVDQDKFVVDSIKEITIWFRYEFFNLL